MVAILNYNLKDEWLSHRLLRGNGIVSPYQLIQASCASLLKVLCCPLEAEADMQLLLQHWKAVWHQQQLPGKVEAVIVVQCC